MLKKKLFLIFAFCFFISNSVATTKQSYKIHLNLENILLKGRDIKKSNDFIEKDNVEFNFQNYIEKNSFIEITLRTSKKNNEYFSLKNILNLISNKRINYMNNLEADKISDIYTYLDEKNKRVFYYRYFENLKLEKEKCMIFVAGTKKNSNNLYMQVLNGVGCSTEIKLTQKNIKEIFNLISVKKN